MMSCFKIVKLRRLGLAASKAKQQPLEEQPGHYEKAQFTLEHLNDSLGTHSEASIHSFIHSFIHLHSSLSDSFIHSFIHSFTYITQ